MKKLNPALVVIAIALSFTALMRTAAPAPPKPAVDAERWNAERNFPPLVFTSRATLDCVISSTTTGRQTMKTLSGGGFSFDTPLAPTTDGRVKLKTPGMMYKFNAFPVKAFKASFSGLGAGMITRMKAEVEVDVDRFSQPGGAGTLIHFSAADIRGDSAYVEYTGLFVRDSDGKNFYFRALFGSVPEGSGEVLPAGPGPDVRLMEKRVSLGSLQRPVIVTTSLYEAEDDVPLLKPAN
jgi:hypothetical protein